MIASNDKNADNRQMNERRRGKVAQLQEERSLEPSLVQLLERLVRQEDSERALELARSFESIEQAYAAAVGARPSSGLAASANSRP